MDEKVKCKNCVYVHQPDEKFNTYYCRRNPPAYAPNNGSTIPSTFPQVYEEDWCGEGKDVKYQFPFGKVQDAGK